jgi:hypothetical protein
VGKNWSLIQGKVGGIQVLAGLAPYSQTVAFIIDGLGGSYNNAGIAIGVGKRNVYAEYF